MTLPVSVDATWMNPSSVQYNAQELRRADSTMFNGDGTAFGVRGGIVRHGDASLAVTVNASDVVTVQAGAAVIPGNSGTGNGCYRTALGAADTGTLTARNATLPRIDLVVFRVLDTDVVAGSPGYTGRVEILTGTAASSPVVPTLPALAVELARISVPASGGGTATVDSSFVNYSVAAGGILPVPSVSRLPTSDSKWDRAVALDTGIEYNWNGTAWAPQFSVFKQSTASVTPGTVFVDVPGLTHTFSAIPEAVYLVEVSLDIERTAIATTGAIAIGTLTVDGVAFTTQIVYYTQAAARAANSKSYVVTGLSAGSHTVKAQSVVTAGTDYRVNSPHSTMTVTRVV